MKFTLPIPHKSLSPNARVHWATKAKHTRTFRRLAYATAIMSLWGTIKTKWPAATIQMTFFWPTNRRRDKDNADASMKAARDGFADAGIVVNDCAFVTLPSVFAVDKNNPRVEVEILEGVK